MKPRPILRWHGGKWMQAPWIIGHFPPHRVYTEAYGGGGSVLLRKPRVHGEVYNDLDDDLVNLFQLLRDPGTAAQLRDQLALTPFARTEFELAFQPADDPIERARRLIVRSYQGFGSDAAAVTPARRGFRKATGFRSDSNRSGTVPARDWVNYPEKMMTVVARMRGVTVECRPALEVMAQHDGPNVLHYADPPYLPKTRAALRWRSDGTFKPMYKHEMTEKDHTKMLAQLKRLKGMVVLSGYPSELYEQKLKGWQMFTTETFADGALPRVEAIWLNPAAIKARASADAKDRARPGPLFSMVLANPYAGDEE